MNDIYLMTLMFFVVKRCRWKKFNKVHMQDGLLFSIISRMMPLVHNVIRREYEEITPVKHEIKKVFSFLKKEFTMCAMDVTSTKDIQSRTLYKMICIFIVNVSRNPSISTWRKLCARFLPQAV